MKFNRGHIVKASLFSWSHGNGYAEMSDLRGLTSFNTQQIWPDSCDVGFSVFNESTGKLRTFVECSEVRDREHELQAIVFASINEQNGRLDKPANRITITLYND
jgi:hypothetical protein